MSIWAVLDTEREALLDNDEERRKNNSECVSTTQKLRQGAIEQQISDQYPVSSAGLLAYYNYLNVTNLLKGSHNSHHTKQQKTQKSQLRLDYVYLISLCVPK